MNIYSFPIGPLGSNCYVIKSGDTALIVDPSVSPDEVLGRIDELTGDMVRGILITHAHNDHICCIDKWHALCPEAKVYMSYEDDYLLKDPIYNCSYMTGDDRMYSFEHEDAKGSFDIDPFNIKVLATPGHSKGSVCFLIKDDTAEALLSGDTLFAGSMGRCDMEGGSIKDMQDSLRMLAALPQELPVFPGHGPDTSIGYELKTNPYLQD